MPCDSKHPKNPGAEQPYASEHDAENGPMARGDLRERGVERDAEERTTSMGPTTRDGQGKG